MRKVALLYIVAVFVPSLVLAWLAVRSLRDQQFLLERQQSLLYQGVADAKAREVQEVLADYQHEFDQRVAALLGTNNPLRVAVSFDDLLRKDWPLAQVGFAVNLAGQILSPAPIGRPEARKFYGDNGGFLANQQSAEVYWNATKSALNSQALANNNLSSANSFNVVNNSSTANNFNQANVPPQLPQAQLPEIDQQQQQQAAPERPFQARAPTQQFQASSSQNRLSSDQNQAARPAAAQQGNLEAQWENNRRYATSKVPQARSVIPQQQVLSPQSKLAVDDNQTSKVLPAETEFRQLIGDDTEGALARFVDNKLSVLFWCRPANDPQLVFGAQLALAKLVDGLRPLVQQVEPALQGEICVALLDDTARPAILSHPGFHATWKRPFVATEIGELLPHWEVAVYLLDPAKLTRSAQALKLTLGLLIAVLVLAIGVGSWLIAADLNRQLTLARQKTDFVSNVSHELKTPLTSIRMFSELLSEGRVADPARQRSYLGIITAETARLTRLINNVLDFARMERGEKKYKFQECDLAAVAGETGAAYRPHLEAAGFHFDCELPEQPLLVHGDPDALAQVIVNLLSNAEKYSDSRKEVLLRAGRRSSPLPYTEVQVLDRGLGVPKGCEEKIFEQFYRAHDSLSSGIQGSGLGLTLARQIARAHGGDVVYEPRDGGGSCFSLRLPLRPDGKGA